MSPLQFLLLVVGILPLVGARATAIDSNAIPLIVIDEVPLPDAVRNLARQINLNIILDPCVRGSGFRAAAGTPNENVSIRLTNVSAGSAMALVLRKHKLAIIANPATTVARIVPTNHTVISVPVSALVSSNDMPVAVIALDDVPLGETIATLARQAGVGVILDRAFTQSELGRARISFRWTNLNAAQALAALLENYDLQLVKEPGGDVFRLMLNPPQHAASHGRKPQ